MKIKYILLLVVLMSMSCKNDDDQPPIACDPIPINFTSLEAEYGCVNTPYQTDINLVDTHTIISSQGAFDALVFGDCMPTIDFSTYDLIIGKQGLRNGNDSIDYTLVRDCDSDIVTLGVVFNQNATTEAPNLTYHVLAMKLAAPEDLNVVIFIN